MPQFSQQLDIEDRCKVKTAAQSVCYLDFDFLTKLSRYIAKNFINCFQNPSVFLRTSLAMESVGLFKRRLRAGQKEKTLPKALRTQALTALTSNFGLVGLVRWVWLGRFGLVGLVW